MKYKEPGFTKLKKIFRQCGIASMLALGAFSCKKESALENIGQADGAFKPKLSANTAQNTNVSLQKPITLGYYPSWIEGWLNEDGKSPFTTLPTSVTHVFLAFARPNMQYTKGSFDISKTGLECYSGSNGNMLKRAVGILKQRGINVILSVGGETFWASPEAYNNINYQQIKDLVDDMGFAGIDWDFEPDGSFANSGSSLNVKRLSTYIAESRKLMPKSAGYLIATAPAGVGALGGQQNDDPTSPYAYSKRNTLTGNADAALYDFTNANSNISLFGFSTTGAMIPVIKAVGGDIDIIAYQAYNTGAAANRKLMYDAYAYYANIYGFRLAHGTHVPNEPWGPYYEHTPQTFTDLASYIYNGGAQNRKGKNDGIMIWNLNLESAKGTKYTGVTYLNVANKILNGQSKETALANAFDYQNSTPVIPTQPTTPPTTTPSNPGTSNPGTGGCGVAAYDAAKAYPTAGSKVYYNGKIFRNKWYTNPNQVPESEEWGPWEFVEKCDGGATATPTTSNPSTSNPSTSNPSTSTPTTATPTSSCGVQIYDAKNAYPTAGTQVYYNGKIYVSQWWANAGQVPEKEEWGPWKFVKVCN